MDKTIWIVGEITQGKTLESVHAQVGTVSPDDNIYVNIISEGGSYFAGKDIYNYLKSLNCNLYTVAKGTIASIATLIQLAAKKENRQAEPNATPLIHNPWAEIAGDSKTLLQSAQALKDTEDELVGIYSMETGATPDQLRKVMEVNDFITLDQYKELGFISTVLEPMKAVAKFEIQDKPNNNQQPINMNKLESMLAKISSKLGIKNEFSEDFKALLVTLADGTTRINVITESEFPEVGNEVQFEDGTPATDGDYTMADGTVISVIAGMISSITEVESMSDKDEELKALKAELQSLRSTNAELQSKIDTYASTVEQINAKLEQNYTAPIRKTTIRKTVETGEKAMFSKDDLKTTKTK
jgi:ATP-dependent protease ClpP protease subunit